MSTALGLLLWVPGWLCMVDAVRRPAWQFERASRNRVFWVVLLTILSPLFVIPYLIGVLPLVVRAAGTSSDRSLYDQ